MFFTLESPTVREVKPYKTNGGTVRFSISKKDKEDITVYAKVFDATLFKVCKQHLGKKLDEVTGDLQLTSVESQKAVLKSDVETPFSYKVYELIVRSIDA